MHNEKHKATILVVDDTPANIDILVGMLREEYTVKVATSGERALRIIRDSKKPDLVLLDIMMPGLDGFEVCRRLRENEQTATIPVIFVTAMTQEADELRGLSLGAVDYITKPFQPSLVKTRIRNQLELKSLRDNLEQKVQLRTQELTLTREVTIDLLATVVDCRDPETGGHINRTKNYVLTLARHLQKHTAHREYLDEATIDIFYHSAPLHDVGKVGVPDSILMKPGKLTSEEFREMQKHTQYGREALLRGAHKLGDNSFLRHAIDIVYCHHEKWNGEGYPQGLSGEDIPLSARIMAIADVYDALITRRMYKPPFPHDSAVKIIKENRGTHFDPLLVDAFLDIHEEFRMIAIEFADCDEERELLMVTSDKEAPPL